VERAAGEAPETEREEEDRDMNNSWNNEAGT
jgi:hypothetical protein